MCFNPLKMLAGASSFAESLAVAAAIASAAGLVAIAVAVGFSGTTRNSLGFGVGSGMLCAVCLTVGAGDPLTVCGFTCGSALATINRSDRGAISSVRRPPRVAIGP